MGMKCVQHTTSTTFSARNPASPSTARLEVFCTARTSKLREKGLSSKTYPMPQAQRMCRAKNS